MYTKEQIQNAFLRFEKKMKGYTNSKNPSQKEFLEALDKEVLFTTPIGQGNAAPQTTLRLL